MVEITDFTAMVTATDNMDMELTITQSPEAGTMIGENTMVSIMATDDAGNMTSCMFNAMVMDMMAPVIECPADIMIANPNNMDMVMVTVPQPSVMENCSGYTWTNSFNNMMDASGMYPEGNTEVVFTVTDAAGNMAMCAVNVMVEEVNVGVNELEAALNLSLYPNPAESFFNLALTAKENGSAKIELIDLTGRVVEQWQMNAIGGQLVTRKLELADLTAGVYQVRISHENGSVASQTLQIH